MKRFDAPEVTLRYLTTERWRWRTEEGGFRDLLAADSPFGFQNNGDGRDFRDAMRGRLQMLAPAIRRNDLAGTVRGVLRELADLHGFDGDERAEHVRGACADSLVDGAELDRRQIDMLVAQAKMNRARHAGRAWTKVAASLATTVHRGLRACRATGRTTDIIVT
jgi:hypothetical protein